MRAIVPFALVGALVLSGCAGPRLEPSQAPGPARTTVPSATAPPAVAPPDGEAEGASTRTDEQGVVVFTARPVDLATSGDTLDFEVTMNTHSVNVGWDLAAQSVLRTDTGIEVQGESWPMGSGHHYAGTLSFPARTADGSSVLKGARVLTLVIRDTDVPERVFVWELGS